MLVAISNGRYHSLNPPTPSMSDMGFIANGRQPLLHCAIIWHDEAVFSLISIKTVSPTLIFALSACTLAVAVCPVDEVIVRGRVVRPPHNAKVLVQLLYAKNVVGESGDTTLENENFTLPLDFLTQSRQPIINGSFEKCARRPVTVIVRLVDDSQNHTFDTRFLGFCKGFQIGLPRHVCFEVRAITPGISLTSSHYFRELALSLIDSPFRRCSRARYCCIVKFAIAKGERIP